GAAVRGGDPRHIRCGRQILCARRRRLCDLCADGGAIAAVPIRARSEARMKTTTLSADASASAQPKQHLARLPNDRWKPMEIVFWLLPVAAFFLFPGYLVLISQI